MALVLSIGDDDTLNPILNEPLIQHILIGISLASDTQASGRTYPAVGITIYLLKQGSKDVTGNWTKANRMTYWSIAL